MEENGDFACVSTDGMVADILTKSIHVPAKWIEARKQINALAGMEELVSLVTSQHGASTHVAIACLCSQSFGSDACKGGVDPAEPSGCEFDNSMATKVPQLRLDANETLARVRGTLTAFCNYSMGGTLTTAVDSSAHAVGKDIKDLRDAIGVQTTYGPVQVGKFIEAGSFQGGVDPAASRELTFTLATDSTFF